MIQGGNNSLTVGPRGPAADNLASTNSTNGGLTLHPPPKKRFDQPQKFVPVTFVVCIIIGLYAMYMYFHCRPLYVEAASRQKALVEVVLFHYITSMLIICYVCAIVESPGDIPKDDPQWDYNDDQPGIDFGPINQLEVKKSGERRHCKWCGKYKPDRSHHCRVCQTCVLRMDHHCPWLYNCVGYNNYKYFFLLLFYAALDLHLIVWTMAESFSRCIMNPATPFSTMFFTFFGETLAGFLCLFITGFFVFHIWLMLKAMTTIEFCEKASPKEKASEQSKKAYNTSVYDLGYIANVRAVLGSNPFLWLLPCGMPAGDGTNFVPEDMQLAKGIESGKGVRIRGHRCAQRAAIPELSAESTPIGGNPYA